MGICKCSHTTPTVVTADYNVDIFDKEKNIHEKSTTLSHKPMNSDYKVKPREKISFKDINRTKESHYNNPNNEFQIKAPSSNYNSDTHLRRARMKLSFSERENLYLLLKNHFLFQDIVNESNFDTIEKLFEFHTIEENVKLFIEGSESKDMFIIINGSCELFKKGSLKSVNVRKYEIFGEIALLDNNSLRTYSAKSTSPLTYGTISYEHYNKIKKEKDTEVISDILKLIECVPLFSYLEESDKETFANCASVLTLTNNTNITLNEAFYISKSGRLICRNQKKTFTVEITTNMYYGITDIILTSKTYPLNIQCKEDSILYVLPRAAFIEILGIDYQYQLIYPYFKSAMLQSEFFSSLFNELQLVPIFELFKIKHYTIGSVVYPKKTKGKIIIVLEGKLQGKVSNQKYEIIFGKVYGEKLITNDIEFDTDVVAIYNSIVIECEWEEMKKKITSFNLTIIKKMKKLSYIEMLFEASESKLIELASIIKKEKYVKNDIIINKGSDNQDKFYFIVKGEVKLKNNNKTIRHYSKGNCFGELFVLKVQDVNDEIIASSDKVTLYSIDKKYFTSLITENIFNDFIKHKMCDEDKEIRLNDIFFINRISKNVSLVHNKMEFYVAKKELKTKEIYEKMKNQIISKMKLDHIFIGTIAKFLENHDYFITLSHYYPNAISLHRYVMENKDLSNNMITINKSQHILFYATSLFDVISYIHNRKFIHGDLTTENIIIDQNGYIKLINLYSTHKINSNYNQSLHSFKFLSPERLNGEPPTFATDFWSIGIILYFIFYERYPFAIDIDEAEGEIDPVMVLNEIKSKNLIFNRCDFKIKEMLERLLCKDKEKRLQTMKGIKELKCFEEMHFEDILTGKEKPPYVPKRDLSDLDYDDSTIKYEEFIEKEEKNSSNIYEIHNWLENF